MILHISDKWNMIQHSFFNDPIYFITENSQGCDPYEGKGVIGWVFGRSICNCAWLRVVQLWIDSVGRRCKNVNGVWLGLGLWVRSRGGFLLLCLPGVAPGSAKGLEWKSIKQLEERTSKKCFQSIYFYFKLTPYCSLHLHIWVREEKKDPTH